MAQTQHTPGPWSWRKMGDSLALTTDGRGCIIVMDFVRQGVRGAQPRFGIRRSEKDRGGLLAPADKIDLASHPDARLIESAPVMLDALKSALAIIGERNHDTLASAEATIREAIELASA